MHLLFLNESGSIAESSESKYFVLAGVAIPELNWAKLNGDVQQLKREYGVRGELKWNAPPNENEVLRLRLLEIINQFLGVKVISVVVDVPEAYKINTIHDEDDLYERTHKALTERFQYYLQDLERDTSKSEMGIVIHPSRDEIENLAETESGSEIKSSIETKNRYKHPEGMRALHHQLISNTDEFTSKYKNLIEGLFLAPARHSVGIQVAGFVAEAIFASYALDNDIYINVFRQRIRQSAKGEVEGYGIVRIPKLPR